MQMHAHKTGPGVANTAMMPVSRLDEPGIGLDDVNHRVLTYSQLRSLDMNPDMRAPDRELQIHLTSNMHRYMWSFNGVKFSEVKESIRLQEGERVRFNLVNDTMMPHPIHLHGMFFDLVNGGGHHKPRKHTVIVKPGEKVAFDVTAEHVGDWAFHCHLLYHMHAGMMNVVSVMPKDGNVPTPTSYDPHAGHDMSSGKMDHSGHEGHDMPKDDPHAGHDMSKGGHH
jgi:FtsP/CotA-like multicopper oxidase with cupredoxin domain